MYYSTGQVIDCNISASYVVFEWSMGLIYHCMAYGADKGCEYDDIIERQRLSCQSMDDLPSSGLGRIDKELVGITRQSDTRLS